MLGLVWAGKDGKGAGGFEDSRVADEGAWTKGQRGAKNFRERPCCKTEDHNCSKVCIDASDVSVQAEKEHTMLIDID